MTAIDLIPTSALTVCSLYIRKPREKWLQCYKMYVADSVTDLVFTSQQQPGRSDIKLILLGLFVAKGLIS